MVVKYSIFHKFQLTRHFRLLEHSVVCCCSCQVLLINAVKDVASALSDLILATKNASGKSSHDPTMTSLKDTAKVWIDFLSGIFICCNFHYEV